MEILFEDKSIVVCIKPVGVLSQAGDEGEESMISLLQKACGSEIYPVHRLDKGVGGVMVFAKTKKAAADLSKQVSEKTMKKQYYAAVYGCFEEKEGILEDLLFKDRAKNKTFVVKRERKGVKKAKLSYSVENEGFFENKQVCVVKVRLYTGRSHQIRVQFASRKHSLLGDNRYGSHDSVSSIQLWSSEIAFVHPETKEEKKFNCLPPENYIINQILFG